MKVGNNPPVTREMLPADSPVRQAAEGMEAHFMKELIRSMRNTVGESEEDKNNKTLQIFRGMLDDEYADRSAKGSGLGLSDLIVRQLFEMEQANRARQQVSVRDVNQNDLLKNK